MKTYSDGTKVSYELEGDSLREVFGGLYSLSIMGKMVDMPRSWSDQR